MEGIQLEERKALGALLDTQSQESVMARIPQFHTAETDNFVELPKTVPEALGAVSIHLENRTHGEGRLHQMQTILEAVRRELPDMPLILGGDLNTNTFDGRDKEDINDIAASPEMRRRCLEDVFDFEPLLPLAAGEGYQIVPGEPKLTRRKPMPDGSFLPLRLDWIMVKGVRAERSHMVSTAKEDFTYAGPGSALAEFTGKELSDHNAIWAMCCLE